MGGIGKTTTARAIYEDCKNDFEAHCLLLDVRQSKNRMKDLQEKLLSNVLNTKFGDICDVVEGSSMIKERLQFKKVLIIIDDVDDIDQLNALGKQCDWFGGGSRIIITTRNQHLINDFHIQKYDVEILPQNEALILFCRHAFKNGYPHEDFRELSLQVLRYAGGLPLALQVLGEHLYRQEKYYWEGTLSTLKSIPKHKIISKLQISFDGLNVLHQDIFLDIACLFKGRLKVEVERRLDCLGLHPKEGIAVLVQKSLISIVNGYIKMHDLLEDMGRYIVIERSNRDVRRYSRLWLLKDIAEVLGDITVSSNAERISMRTDYHHDDVICLESGWEGALKNMNKLSFLELYGDVFKGNYHDVNVSQSIGQLYKELRWFSWEDYPGLSLPKSFHPRNLVHLHMQSSQIEETPDVSHMPNLEVLNLSCSFRLVHVHKSLGNHMKIKHINLEYCKKLTEFPQMNQMKSLEILDLSFTSLQSFPEIYGNLNSLRKLKLREAHIKFTSLEVVAEAFLGLVHLKITGSGIVKTLDFSHLPYLEKLDLSNSEELLEVHASLGVHKTIKNIVLKNCSKLVGFPIIDDMNSLEVLNLSRTSLRSFPEITGNVNRLMTLNLDGTMITTLPWSIGKVTNLIFLSMQNCENLLTLPVSILGLQIETVSISSGVFKYFKGSIDDEAVVQNEVELHSPQRKRQKQLIGSEGMGQHFCAQMELRYCKSLEVLQEVVLSRVNTLSITECPILTSWICFKLVDLLDNYQHLCHLQLHQREDIAAFLELDSMADMLRKREKFFEVNLPGRHIPSWFQYKFSTSSVIVFLPPLSEWYTDKFRGFFLGGLNAEIGPDSLMSIFGYSLCHRYRYYSPGNVYTLVMGIPVDNIREAMNFWGGQKERTLFHLSPEKRLDETNQSPRWGLSLVYSEGEVIELDPHQVMIVIDNDESPDGYTFRVNIAESRDVIEELYRSRNPISWASFQQQTLSQVGTSAMAQDLSAPHLLPLFPSGPDLCYREGEQSSICYGKDGDSELELKLS